jgi:hypothetical protein
MCLMLPGRTTRISPIPELNPNQASRHLARSKVAKLSKILETSRMWPTTKKLALLYTLGCMLTMLSFTVPS